MKSRNISKSIAQRGGLMIEALAMLGLIAVVTPTMYKKSAERTMEVEDINTASTIRTIMNAANDYVGANYSTIIADMGEGDSVKTLPEGLITSYLPYGFDVNKALYNYGTPQLAIAKKGNNLTTFALFETNTDIGQERTSRIASLVGSSGGYVTGEKKARGIGGIWKLEGEEYSKVFPNGADAAQYSIVTASADTISAATGNEIDMDKYLQRGRDNGDDPKTLWKNSMRTDLYMGNVDNTYDVYNNANHHPATETFSIRNIKSLIVGAEGDPNETTDNPSPYGLYIADGGKPDAFIHGNLIAAEEQFKANANLLGFGRNLIIEGDTTTEEFHFKVDTEGNTTADGTLTNLMDVNLASKLKDDASGPAWTDVKIGALGNSPHLAESSYLIQGDHKHNPKGKLSLINENIASFQMPSDNENLGKATHNSIIFMNSGYKKVNSTTTAADGSTSTASADVKAPQYNATQYFPVVVGSNMEVEGLLAAGQLDTQKIRAATLSVGSKKIDDSKKWLTADEDGVTIEHTTSSGDLTQAQFQDNIINIGVQGAGANGGAAGLALLGAGATSAAILTGGGVHALMENNELIINAGSEDSSKTRTWFEGGAVDLSDANFNIGVGGSEGYTTAKADRRYIFSVQANDTPHENSVKNAFTSTKSETAGYKYDNPYDIAMHGRVLIGDAKSGQFARGTETNIANGKYHVSIGQYNAGAGVNIVPNNTTGDSSNIVYIDQGATSTTNNYNDTEPGTVYIRKGYVEVKSDNYVEGHNLSADQGKGVIVASRLVANNPAKDSTKIYGGQFPDLLTETERKNYGINGSRYDTYMVNPAYTSVMHDIKLTTRGGARLSDILPDFINKGIYVVNNTISEYKLKTENKTFSESFTKDCTSDIKNCQRYVTAQSFDEDYTETKDLSDKEAWASPFLGVVPAPQCPPGYVRVITLTPASWEMAQAGSIHLGGKEGDYRKYFVFPDTPSDKQVEAAVTSGQRPVFDKVSMVVDNGDNTTTSIPVTVGAGKGFADISKVKTSTYVLQANSPVKPAAPLMFQQSTRLKSMVVPLVNNGKTYVQGWSAIMGFLYPKAKYDIFKFKNAEEVETDSYYWNVFPVTRGTIEGYATVYCYFNRTDISYGKDSAGKEVSSYNPDANKFIDMYNYMSSMKWNEAPINYKKSTKINTNLDRLNDPALKYDEAW